METMKGRWKEINNFKRYEFDDPREPGTGDLMAFQLVWKLDQARKLLNAPIAIHWRQKGGVALDGHSKNSYHYPRLESPYLRRAILPPIKAGAGWDALKVLEPAKAVDLHVGSRKKGIIRVPIPYPEQLAVFHRVGFTGIGLYPGWKPRGGWHLDIRSTPLFWLGIDVPTMIPGRTRRKYIYL